MKMIYDLILRFNETSEQKTQRNAPEDTHDDDATLASLCAVTGKDLMSSIRVAVN